MMSQIAESEFRRRDNNGDGYLNLDEMPENVKQELSRWDTNRDGLLSMEEYRAYYLARLTNGGGEGGGGSGNPVTIILDEEFDKRPDLIKPSLGIAEWILPTILSSGSGVQQ